jgi:c-di-GMP-binding flagellar brake protein YcgR
MAQGISDRRRAKRAEIALECTLHRRTGSPVECRTVDVGTGGMSVSSARPLAPDEVLEFDLPDQLHGHARVLRQQAHQVYALRFERLMEPVRRALDDLVARVNV